MKPTQPTVELQRFPAGPGPDHHVGVGVHRFSSPKGLRRYSTGHSEDYCSALSCRGYNSFSNANVVNGVRGRVAALAAAVESGEKRGGLQFEWIARRLELAALAMVGVIEDHAANAVLA